MPSASNRTKLSLRLMQGDNIAIGPGKADLLEGIRDTGSIAAAGRQMGMSYKRAWLLVDTMNNCFKEPLVETSKGGAARGGARLTPLGELVLSRYRSLQTTAEAAVARGMDDLEGLLAD